MTFKAVSILGSCHVSHLQILLQVFISDGVYEVIDDKGAWLESRFKAVICMQTGTMREAAITARPSQARTACSGGFLTEKNNVRYLLINIAAHPKK